MTRGRRPRPSQRGTGIRLHPLHLWLLYGGLGLVAVTGVVWAVWWDLPGREPTDALHSLTQLHGAGGFIALLLLGSMLPQHVRFGWNTGRNRWSGGSVAAFAAVLILTGYALYYAGEDLREFAKWVHLLLGLGAVAILPLHIWLGRRSRAARAPAQPVPGQTRAQASISDARPAPHSTAARDR